jgi:hypothetical protein
MKWQVQWHPHVAVILQKIGQVSSAPRHNEAISARAKKEKRLCNATLGKVMLKKGATDEVLRIKGDDSNG